MNHPYTGKDFHDKSVFYFDVEPQPTGESNGDMQLLDLMESCPFKVGDQIVQGEHLKTITKVGVELVKETLWCEFNEMLSYVEQKWQWKVEG